MDRRIQGGLIVSARDAEALAAMLGRHRRVHPFEPDASDALADLLMTARLVPTERLPADRVAMDSTVLYREEARGAQRMVTLVLPQAAEPAKGRVSVLSPIGLAFIGRARGARVVVGASRLRILDTFQRYRGTLSGAASGYYL